MLDVQSSQPAAVSFDYAALDAPLADDLRATAARVRSKLDDTKAAVFAIGRDLLAVKDRLPHGAFGDWLAAEFDMSDRTARNYMQAARVLGEKSETVSVLAPNAIYALASPSMPDETRAGVIERVEAGERVPEVEIRHLARSANAQARRDARRAKMTPRQRKADDALERERAVAEAKAERQDAAAAEAADLLRLVLADQFKDFATLLSQAHVWTFARKVEEYASAERVRAA